MRWSLEEDRTLAARCKAQLKESGGDVVHDWTDIALGLPLRNNKDCRKRWVNVVAGHIKKGQWTEEEDQILIDAVRRHLSSGWPAVAQKLHSRSPDQCAKRWQQNLNPELDRGAWTADEDRTLYDAVRRYGRSWVKIRDRHFPKRATNTIKNHYSMLLKKPEKAVRRSKSATTTPTPSHVDTDSLYSSQDGVLPSASSESNPGTPSEAIFSSTNNSARPSLSWSVPSTPESLSSQASSWDSMPLSQPTHVDPKLVGGLPQASYHAPAYALQGMSFNDPFSGDTISGSAYPDSFQDWCLSTLDQGIDSTLCLAPDQEFDPGLGEWVLPTTEKCGEGATLAANNEYTMSYDVQSMGLEPWQDGLVSPIDLTYNQSW